MLSSHCPQPPRMLDAAATATLLPWTALADEIAAVLRDASVRVPARSVMPLPQGGTLFVMPATDSLVAMTKLITLTPANAGTPRPTIQGDVVVFDVSTGERRLVLDGPTITARRTAAASLLAARHLAQEPQGPLLIVGAGVQGLAHLEAFVHGLGVRDVRVASRSAASAEALVQHGRALGVKATVVADAHTQVRHCPLIVTCTPAHSVVLDTPPLADAFVAAVGAYTPTMAELSPTLCRHIAQHGHVVVDTPDARHEAGDLLQAGLDVSAMPTLRDVLEGPRIQRTGPVLFKSCGWAGWDLAAARLAVRAQDVRGAGTTAGAPHSQWATP
ncbi:delta(1)-pyrroline-2-carboxylate reductase family protein [Acidovorax sp. sic0104]|uniref:delta(1)-pyrroline-2-carboxylate reductase family protein n=1 Tax=Acidovorax sp. sic0104 TaxID=2854784 RepID=UPI0021067219|nr:delta(1)-pyrroline-2-carboxylate reductase family protein [Acidovorax sp. sic0104]